jgi:hypothetical protein
MPKRQQTFDILDPESTTEKRASWELFSFTVSEGKRVEVAKKSYSAFGKHI